MKMIIKKIATKNGNLIIMGKNGEEAIFGYFKKNEDGKFAYLRPSDEDEWGYALRNWQSPVEMEQVEINPFPYLHYIGDTLYAYYLKSHPYAGIVGRFLVEESKNGRIMYESLNLVSAIDNKYGTDKIHWSPGAGENLKSTFEQIKEWDSPDQGQYVQEFGVDSLGYPCWARIVCEKENCSCIGSWQNVFTHNDVVAVFGRD